MTVPAQTASQTVVAAAGQTVIPFSFRCDDSTLLHVWVNDVEQGGFAIALNADQTAAPGGTVTIGASTAGDVVTVERVSPESQTLALTAYNPFTAVALMLGLDRMVMLLQEFAAWLARGLVVSRKNASSMSTQELPAPAPGYALGWVSDGARYKLGNVTFASISGAGVVGRNLVKNEVPTGAVDGVNAAFVLAHAPFSGAYMDVKVGGVIFPPGRYALAGSTITFAAGHIPPAGEDIYVDYWY